MSKKPRARSHVIRAVSVADAEAITEIFSQASTVAGTLQAPYPSVDDWRERLSKRDPLLRSLVVEVQGRVVGTGSLHLAAPSRMRTRHAAGIGMALREEFRGRGLGGALLDALLALGERWCGILRFELDVYVDNAPALALYRSRGFVVEGIARAAAQRDGDLVDVIRMARLAKTLPWPRVTAEDAAARTPRLPASAKRDPKSN